MKGAGQSSYSPAETPSAGARGRRTPTRFISRRCPARPRHSVTSRHLILLSMVALGDGILLLGRFTSWSFEVVRLDLLGVDFSFCSVSRSCRSAAGATLVVSGEQCSFCSGSRVSQNATVIQKSRNSCPTRGPRRYESTCLSITRTRLSWDGGGVVFVTAVLTILER